MFNCKCFRAPILLVSALLTINWSGHQCTAQSDWLQSAQAASDQVATKLPVSKTISQKELEKYKQISVTVEEDGKKFKYSGVPLRELLADMMPEVKLDTMPEWKALARQELIMEATGDDGYSGLVTALEVAMNKPGDRFFLATLQDGKPVESGIRLICKMDEAHLRWVRQVVSLRIVAVSKSITKS